MRNSYFKIEHHRLLGGPQSHEFRIWRGRRDKLKELYFLFATDRMADANSIFNKTICAHNLCFLSQPKPLLMLFYVAANGSSVSIHVYHNESVRKMYRFLTLVFLRDAYLFAHPKLTSNKNSTPILALSLWQNELLKSGVLYFSTIHCYGSNEPHKSSAPFYGFLYAYCSVYLCVHLFWVIFLSY